MNNDNKKRLLKHKSANYLFEAAMELNLDPKWISDYGLIQTTIKKRPRFIYHSRSELNTAFASAITRDKLACRLVLDQFHLPNIPYCIANSQAEAIKFLNQHKKIIIKPIDGDRSNGVMFVDNAKQIDNMSLENLILEKFIPGQEIRYLFLKQRIIAVQERRQKPTLKEPWNKERHSLSSDLWDKNLIQITKNIAQAIGLTFGAVDFIVGVSGKHWILEVNSAPALWPFHEPVSGPIVNVSKMLLMATFGVPEKKNSQSLH